MNRNCMRMKVMAALATALLLAGCGPSTPEEFLASAKQELAKNDRAAAVIHLRNALQKNPDLGEARFLLGKALLENGDAVAAEKELRKAMELQYPADQAIPALARVMMLLGQSRKVIDEFGKTELGSPEGTADLQTTLGLALLSQGNVSAAQAAFAAALAAQADYPRAVLGEARIKASAGELKPALDLVEKALAKAPDLAEGWQLKGRPSGGSGATRRGARCLSQGHRNRSQGCRGAFCDRFDADAAGKDRGSQQATGRDEAGCTETSADALPAGLARVYAKEFCGRERSDPAATQGLSRQPARTLARWHDRSAAQGLCAGRSEIPESP